MRFKSQVRLIDLGLDAYSKQLDSVMTETVKEAARSWLQTVLVIIPTWSRASRATFSKLADAVEFNLTFGPVKSKRDRFNLGRSSGDGGLMINPGVTWHFFYETDLKYLIFNEFNRAVFGDGSGLFSRAGLKNPGPYKFQEAGSADFKSFAEQVLLPNPFEFIRGIKI